MEPVTELDEPFELSSTANELNLPAGHTQLSRLRELLLMYKVKLGEVHPICTEEHVAARAVIVQYQGYEKALGLLELASFDNKDLSKVYSVFTYLMSEMRLARDYVEAAVVPPLNFYAEGVPVADYTCEGGPEQMVGSAVAFLGDTFENLTYISALIVNSVHQLHNLYNKNQPKHKNLHKFFKGVNLHSVLDALGGVLSAIAYIDAVVTDNGTLVAHWKLYKQMMQLVKNDPVKYGVTPQQERQLRKCLNYIDKSLLESRCLETTLAQGPWDDSIPGNKELQAQFQLYFRARLDKANSAPEDSEEWQRSRQAIDCICLYALYRRLFPKEFDSKLFSELWALQKKVPAVIVTGQVLIYPSELLTRHARPVKAVKVDPKDPAENLLFVLQNADEKLPVFIQKCSEQYTAWAVHMHSSPWDQDRGELLLQGLLLAQQVHRRIQLFIALHQQKDVAFRPAAVSCIMQGISIVKAVAITVGKKQEALGLAVDSIMELVLGQILVVVKSAAQRSSKYGGNLKTEALAAATVMQQVSRGVLTPAKIDLLRLCADYIDIKSSLKLNERKLLAEGLWKLSIFVEFQDHLTAVSDCSFMYWASELNAHFLRTIYENPSTVHSLKYLYMALEDVIKHLECCVHMEDPSALKRLYTSEKLAELENQLIMPLAHAIESDLRLHIHSLYISDLEKQNPLKNPNLSWFLESQPLMFCGNIVDIKKKVENYLERTFYNMTVLNLNDWQVYEEMRSLAHQKYQLAIGECHLPCKQLDQSMDLLEITNKLQAFVNRFKYNLHSQFFIEATSKEDKNVACVTFMHIGKSLKTHGLGLVSTTISNSYKLLAKRFKVFSQFLQDQYIFSYLVNESKQFIKTKDYANSSYPYENAERFTHEIRKLGILDGELTYLDKFRLLVTQIGNVLGLVRMIKSAALHETSVKTDFIPNTQKLSELPNKYSAASIAAISMVDKINATVTNNFTEDTDYFSLLAQTFQGVPNSTEAEHLKEFYMIVPALSINFVESLLAARGKLTKAKSANMYFTDDGLAMGLAYILKILEQEAQFDSLHWFEAVEFRFTQEKEGMKGTSAMQQISLKKSAVFKQEFELFKYCFSGARTFFNQV